MKYFLYALLLLLIVGCKNTQVPSVKPIEVQAPDSLPDPLSANGWVFVRTSVKGGLYVPPSAPRKVKFKNVGNDYSKTKDKSTVKESLTVKDKSVVKEKPKVKADIIGDGNALDKSRKFPDWVAWVAILLALLFVLWPKIKKLIFPF